MSSYTKMSLVIVIEIFVLGFINLIIKSFNPAFNGWYIIPAQISLLIAQAIGLILQKIEFNKESKSWDELYENLKRKE